MITVLRIVAAAISIVGAVVFVAAVVEAFFVNQTRRGIEDAKKRAREEGGDHA